MLKNFLLLCLLFSSSSFVSATKIIIEDDNISYKFYFKTTGMIRHSASNQYRGFDGKSHLRIAGKGEYEITEILGKTAVKTGKKLMQNNYQAPEASFSIKEMIFEVSKIEVFSEKYKINDALTFQSIFDTPIYIKTPEDNIILTLVKPSEICNEYKIKINGEYYPFPEKE